MSEPTDFYYEPDTANSLSIEVVTAVAQAHNEDVIAQKWRISDDINTDALDGLFENQNLDMTLQFDADGTTITIIADESGDPIIKVTSYR